MMSVTNFMLLVALYFFVSGMLNVYYGGTRKEIKTICGRDNIVAGLVTLAFAFAIVILP